MYAMNPLSLWKRVLQSVAKFFQNSSKMSVIRDRVELVGPFSYPLTLCLAKTKFDSVNEALSEDAAPFSPHG